MRRLRAEEILLERGSSLPNRQVYELTLLATGGDEDAAQDAQTEAVRREMDRGEMPQP